MAEGGSQDLEAPLMVSEQPHERHEANGGAGSSAFGDGKRSWKMQKMENLRRLARASSRVPMHQRIKEIEVDENMDSYFQDDHSTSKGRREYNKKQLETLEGFREVDKLSSSGDPKRAQGDLEDTQGKEALQVKRAINWSNSMNVVLLALKIYASIQSGSLAIIASTLDSLLDLLAGGLLWFAHWYTERASRNHGKYPIGGLRIQPVGIVVFSAIMATLGLQILLSGLEELMEGGKEQIGMRQLYWMIFIMTFATVVKLALYLYCSSFKDEIVSTYAMDHFFDVVTNVAGLAAALLARYFAWWIDPAGAILLALYTITNWGKSMIEHALDLVGKAASPQFCQKVTYMALNHDPRIDKLDTVRAYTFGSMLFVEVDIVLPKNMELQEAHEIGEGLQNMIERLPEVERAFVHLDYDCFHKPEHSGF